MEEEEERYRNTYFISTYKYSCIWVNMVMLW
jgi:hypothetical protein